MTLPALLAVFVLQAPDAAPGPPAPAGAETRDDAGADAPAAASDGPRLWPDLAVAAAGTASVALLKPDIRSALSRDARLSNVVENFAHPLRQVRRGTARDSDPFWVNNVAHPGLFALEALYLKRRGYSDGGAFLFTQAHSVVWEFVVEGAAFEPSGKDLVADAAGAAGAIWLLRPVAAGAERRIADGRGRWWDGVLRCLDPVARVSGGRGRPNVQVRPRLGADAAGLELVAGF
jgi:hypothetical protein